jgi:3-oxoacyl-[acyl-carrier protein] reductase
MQLKNDLTGRVAFVTAAGGPGIGGATARLLAAHGAHVVVTDLSGDRAAKVAAGVTGDLAGGVTGDLAAELPGDPAGRPGQRVLGRGLDVTDDAAVDALVAEVLAELGSIDILVNNAGTSRPEPVWRTSTESWRRVVDVCLTGAFFTMRAVLPGMIERRTGSVVNIASTEAWTSRTPGNTAYHAAKAGLLALSRSTAVQVGPHGVRVNCVAPGLTPNPMLNKVIPQEYLDQMRSEIPLGEPSTPEDIADAVLFLASDASRSVTGETIAVCGGSAMRP